MEEAIVSGVATDDTQSKITVIGVPDVPGKAGEIFTVVAEAGANIDMIVQNVSTAENQLSDISFTLLHSDRARVVEALRAKQAAAEKNGPRGSGREALKQKMMEAQREKDQERGRFR